MKNWNNLSDWEKREELNSIIGKKIRLIYDYSDLPSGKIGPVRLIGKITSVELTRFLFERDGDIYSFQLTIAGVVDLDEI